MLEVRSRKSLVARSGRFPLPLFSQELLVLLAAGLSLVEALETLAQKEKRAEWRAVLASLLGVLRQGQPLSSALEQAPAAFPPLYVATVRAAEKTSDLVPALTRYVAYQAQLDAIRRRVVNASIYPLLLIGVGGLVTLFLMLYVVPRFGKIYAERSADLPLFSQLLIAWGELVQGHAAVVIGSLAARRRRRGVRAAPDGRARRARQCAVARRRRSASTSRSTSWRASTAPPACC